MPIIVVPGTNASGVESVSGANVDNTDPENPIIIPSAGDGSVVVTPVTGNTVTIAAGTEVEFINAAGTLAALTINFPVGEFDAQRLAVVTKTQLTLVTCTGASLSDPITSMLAHERIELSWCLAVSKWI